MKNKHLGTNFDDFLEEENLLAKAEAVAIKRVIAFQIEELMKKEHLTKAEMARKMHTSRSALDRLIDPKNAAVTLQTLNRAAKALGKHLRIELSKRPIQQIA